LIDRLEDYDLETRSPHLAESRPRYVALSQAVPTTRATLDVVYGPHPREKLDIFRAEAPNAPVVVFFHGGYWKGGHKDDRRFPARAFNRAGVTWISVGYPLCPEVTIGQIVDSARRAFAWIAKNIGAHGGNPNAIHVIGNSAGGHLAGMLAASGWTAAYGLDANPLKGVIMISPVADLRPLLKYSFNETFSLSAPDAEKLSPTVLPSEARIPAIVAVGELEPGAFHEQGRRYLAHRAAQGARDTMMVVEGKDHFSILGELDRDGSPLQSAVLAQMGIRR